MRLKMKIYIILTHTGTTLSKIVKWYTKKGVLTRFNFIR